MLYSSCFLSLVKAMARSDEQSLLLVLKREWTASTAATGTSMVRHLPAQCADSRSWFSFSVRAIFHVPQATNRPRSMSTTAFIIIVSPSSTPFCLSERGRRSNVRVLATLDEKLSLLRTGSTALDLMLQPSYHPHWCWQLLQTVTARGK